MEICLKVNAGWNSLIPLFCVALIGLLHTSYRIAVGRHGTL